MPDWEQRIREHRFIQTLGEIAHELGQIDPPTDTEAHEELERARHVIARLDTLARDADAELLAPELLEGPDAHLVDVLGEIRSYRESGEVRWLTSINGILDTIIELIGWQLPYVAAETAGLREAAGNYRRAAAQFLRGIEDDVATAKGHVNELEQAIEEAKATFAQTVEDATQQVSNAAATAEQRAAAVSASVDTEKTRFDALTTEYQRNFTAGEATRTTKSDATLADEVAKHDAARVKAEEAFQALMTNLNERSASLMASLEQQKAEALKLVNATGAIAYSGSYGGYAAQQGRLATIWSVVAVLALMALAGFGLWQISQLKGALDPVQLILRLVVTIPAFALVAISARESGKHRENERHARRLELELAAIDPYLALLDEPQRKEIKAQVATRMFAQPEIVSESAEALTPVAKELFALVKDLAKK